MINKKYFGKRIAACRRQIGLSQTALAERLGVTSQAVSKWECGSTIPDTELLLELSRLYSVSINELLEGRDLVGRFSGVKCDKNGIAYFVPREERMYNIPWAKAIREEKWIEKNWNEVMTSDSYPDEIGAKIASLGDVILELGAGPGGGFMPYILKADPGATVIINDLSPTVVEEWKLFLDKTLESPNLFYAVFDFCKMPLADQCIDVISDGGGIGNCEGDKASALKEAYRVLKPGGVLVTSTGFVTKDTLASLPIDAQRILLEKRPDVFEDLYEDTVLAGFSRIDSMISGSWNTDDDDSSIAELAKSLGVNLKFTSYVRYCTKE